MQMTRDRELHTEFREVALLVNMDAAVPEGIMASVDLLTVDVEWESVEGATYYLVYYRSISGALQ